MRITIHHTSFVAVFGACIVDIVALQHIVTNIGLASDHAATAKTKTQEATRRVSRATLGGKVTSRPP
jgi:hypothetical protein